MNKQVIHIFGASGSGTSTLGKLLCEKLGYYHMDTDAYFWEATDPPYTVKRSAPERLALMRSDIQKHDGVVISGSLTDWGDELIPLFTLAIRLVTDTAIRIDRLRQREKAHFGTRIEAGGDMYENHAEFMQWAADYDNGDLSMRSKLSHDEWQKLLCCRLLVLDGSLPLLENFEIVRKSL